MEDSAAFVSIIDRAIAQSRAGHGHALTLFDVSDSQVMSSGMANTYQASPAQFVRSDDRIAVVLSSQLSRMQVKEDSVSDATQFVATRVETEAFVKSTANWLIEGSGITNLGQSGVLCSAEHLTSEECEARGGLGL